jgi:hypothetical protein
MDLHVKKSSLSDFKAYYFFVSRLFAEVALREKQVWNI